MSQQQVKEFGDYEEVALVSLFIDYPEVYQGVYEYIKPETMSKPEVSYILAILNEEQIKHGQIPTRALLRDRIIRTLTADDVHQQVLDIIDTPVNERDVASLRDRIFSWSKNKAYGQLYAPETIQAYQAGELDKIAKIVDDANKITNVTSEPLWVLDRAEDIIKPQAIEKLQTGNPRLDLVLNDGGPSPGEVLCYMAPPNVGKSAVLVNSAVNSTMLGYNTLMFALEMTDIKTAIRTLGAMTEIPTRELGYRQEEVLSQINLIKAGLKSKLGIFETGEISTSHIRHLVNYLKRTKNFVPKVIVIDYLELMISTDPYANRDEYQRQKRVAKELLDLAKELRVLIYTASQGNRGSTKLETRTMEDMAESFGKNMPLTYIVTLNQTDVEYAQTPPHIRLFVAKNREGPKNITISCTMDYTMMKMKEIMT